jgi:DNA-binding XRE family transcriptional regulator
MKWQRRADSPILRPRNFIFLTFYITLLYRLRMDGISLRTWRQKWGFSQAKLGRALGVSTMAVAYWEWGHRRIPPLLPLALEALENRLNKEKYHGSVG